MFLFGPDFFRRRGAKLQRVSTTGDVNGRACDELLAVLRPGFGLSEEDRVVLFIDHQDHLLRRVQFTLNALESTRGAEVQVGPFQAAKAGGRGVPHGVLRTH